MKSLPRRFGLRFLFVLLTFSCVGTWWYSRVPTPEHMAKRFPVAKTDELRSLMRKLPRLTGPQRAEVFFEYAEAAYYSSAQQTRLENLAFELAKSEPEYALDWARQVFDAEAIGDDDAFLGDPAQSLFRGLVKGLADDDISRAVTLLQYVGDKNRRDDLAMQGLLHTPLMKKSFSELTEWLELNWPGPPPHSATATRTVAQTVSEVLLIKDPDAYLELLPKNVGVKPYRWIDLPSRGLFDYLIEVDCFALLNVLSEAYPDPPKHKDLPADSFREREPLFVDNGFPIVPDYSRDLNQAIIACIDKDPVAFQEWADRQPNWRFKERLTHLIIDNWHGQDLESADQWLRSKIGKWSGLEKEVHTLFNRMWDKDVDRVALDWVDVQVEIEDERSRYDYVLAIAHNRFRSNPTLAMKIVDRLPFVDEEACPDAAREYFERLWEERDEAEYKPWLSDPD